MPSDEWTDCVCVPAGTGSRSQQCNMEGKCACKPGVTGDKCDRCDANFYDFGAQGCKPCGCNVAGSLDGEPRCDPATGTCVCKDHVEGQRCDRSKPGYFHLDAENVFGSTPCFCYGHSSVCRSASGYVRSQTESVFARSDEKWTVLDTSRSEESASNRLAYLNQVSPLCLLGRVLDEMLRRFLVPLIRSEERIVDCCSNTRCSTCDFRFQVDEYLWAWKMVNYREPPFFLRPQVQMIAATATGHEPVYLQAPERYLGDQRGSYNQDLVFTLRLSDNGARVSIDDLVLEVRATD